MTEVFARPAALALVLAAPLVGLLLLRLDALRRARSLAAFGPRWTEIATRSAGRAAPILAAAGLLLAVVALAGPVWGESARKQVDRGADLVVCLDVSRSMLAQDERPDRLSRAKAEIAALAERARGDRLALVAFAGDARVVVPLTRDAASFVALASQTDPESAGRGGTDLGVALDAALRALPGGGEGRTVLLLTDGEDLEGKGLRAAQTLRGRGVVVHCVGFGSSSGAKVAVEGPRGVAFLRAPGGGDVISSMDAAGLRRIAEATGGAFVEARSEASPLVALYERHVVPAARAVRAAEERRERTQRFQGPLLGAFVLWALGLASAVRRTR